MARGSGRKRPETRRRAPSYLGLRPRSATTSRVASASSKKSGTTCEVLLWRALRKAGIRFKKNVASLPGKPDVVIPDARIAIFCDGDFWHGRKLRARLAALADGHNAEYWVAKIQRNVQRDRANARALRAAGWTVLRFWETKIREDPDAVAARIRRELPML